MFFFDWIELIDPATSHARTQTYVRTRVRETERDELDERAPCVDVDDDDGSTDDDETRIGETTQQPTTFERRARARELG